MAEADFRIITLMVFFVASYGVFMYFYANEQETRMNSTMPGQNYTEPSSTGFFSTVKSMIKINIEQPEIGFVNSIFFIPLGFLLVFVGLRYFRGI